MCNWKFAWSFCKWSLALPRAPLMCRWMSARRSLALSLAPFLWNGNFAGLFACSLARAPFVWSDVCLGPGLHMTPEEASLVPPGMHGSPHMGGLEESSVGYECVIRRNSFILYLGQSLQVTLRTNRQTIAPNKQRRVGDTASSNLPKCSHCRHPPSFFWWAETLYSSSPR